jgi:hypothetical protein
MSAEIDEERGEKPPLVASPVESPTVMRGGPRIAWDDEQGPSRGRRLSGTSGSRRRSASRNSIRSVQSRTQAQSIIPIKYRTLSFRIAESQGLSDEEQKEASARRDGARRETISQFESTDFHKINIKKIY